MTSPIIVELRGTGPERFQKLEAAMREIGVEITAKDAAKEQLTLLATPEQTELVMKCQLVGMVQLN